MPSMENHCITEDVNSLPAYGPFETAPGILDSLLGDWMTEEVFTFGWSSENRNKVNDFGMFKEHDRCIDFIKLMIK